MWSLIKLVVKACRADKALLIGILGCAIARNVTMVQQITFPQFMQSFFPPDSIEEQNLWQELYLISNVCSVPMIMFSGRLADRFSAKITVPVSIVFQTVVMTGYLFITSPY